MDNKHVTTRIHREDLKKLKARAQAHRRTIPQELSVLLENLNEGGLVQIGEITDPTNPDAQRVPIYRKAE